MSTTYQPTYAQRMRRVRIAERLSRQADKWEAAGFPETAQELRIKAAGHRITARK